MTIIRYRIFRAQVDLGLFAQVIASPFSGFSSTAEGGVDHFAVHFSPILVLCSPVLALARSPLALDVVQDLLSAGCLPAIYLIARGRMSTPAAVLVASVCCAYPPLIAMTVGDFHELAFATPTLLWLAYALETRRFRTATALAVAALLIKEDVTLVLAFVSAVSWLRVRRGGDVRLARFFASIATAAVGILVLYFVVVRPALSPTHASFGYKIYDWRGAGSTPNGVAGILSPVRRTYLAGVFAPLLGVPLLAPAVAFAVPGLLEVLASHEAITIDLSTHYAACWLPYLFLAFIVAVASLERRSRRIAFAALGCCLAVSLWIDAYASPANFWYSVYRLPDAGDARLERLLRTLPRDASIGSDLWIFAHLGLHPHATIDPTGAQFVVVDRRCDTAYCRERIFPFVASSLARRTLHVRSSDGGIELYERRPPETTAPFAGREREAEQRQRDTLRFSAVHVSTTTNAASR